MQEFIHTYSAVVYLEKACFDKLKHTYENERDGKNEKIWFYNHEDRTVFSKYADRGFRMEIHYTPNNEKKYHKKHETYTARWFVTPAKLLYPGQAMAKLFTPEEYAESCARLADILKEIMADSGVDLLDGAKLRRVDVTKDIITPSDAWSREVIRLAKKALFQYGYNLRLPTPEEIAKTGWLAENSAMFRNRNRAVHSKIYNKLEDMKNNHYDTGNLTGLLRFELILKRKFMKNEGFLLGEYLTMDELPVILRKILYQAEDLMQTHITSPLWRGKMLPKDCQQAEIRRYCRTKKKKYEKMMQYRRKFNRKNGIEKDERNPTVERYFDEIGLSPLYTIDDMHIPAFSELLAMCFDTEKSGTD